MQNAHLFYIGGEWVEPSTDTFADVINPATEEAFASVAMGGPDDVDRAVAAARAAFPSFSETTREERLALFERILEVYKERRNEVGPLISQEMGAPISFANRSQAGSGYSHFKAAYNALKTYEFEEDLGTTKVVKEPIGVCGLITPWNWPLNQIAAKVAPALAAGCTMVLKPSEVAPLNALWMAEVLHEAGVPAGVFNLVNGDGPTVGSAMSAHPDIDMMSFTGSTRAGIEVAKASAPTVKRVAQELGGKSANIILDDADLESVVKRDVLGMCSNSGQSCNAGTRMLVPAERMDEAARIAAAATEKIVVGDPSSDETTMGPVVSEAQFDKIQGLIESGIEQGATVEAGGPGRPEGVDTGYFVQPTVFSNVTNDMRIAQEEIFGPVISLIGYEDEDDAVRIANDSDYGLSGYISSADPDRARKVARRIRTGMMHINGAHGDINAPFGGYKQSGNGREWGHHGFDEFLEVKSIYGYNEQPESV